MYDYIRGTVVATEPDTVVLEVGGVGYRLLVSGATAGRVRRGAPTTLFVHHVIRDEVPTLFGFADARERALFLELCSVSRVGPSMALNVLSAMEPARLVACIEGGEVGALSRVKGVGRRTAERLCVDLKGRLGPVEAGGYSVPLTDRGASLLAALVALGYPRARAEPTAQRVAAAAPTGASLEALVKQALGQLAGSAPAAAVE